MPRTMTCTAVYCVLFHLLLLSGCTGLPNVALSGTASQSSTHPSGLASYAIDGNRDSEFFHNSCSHTEPGLSHWWRLLLPAVYRITSISITNRNVGGERINNAVILIGNSFENNGNSNPRCAVIYSIPNGATASFSCNGMVGRLVNVYLSGTDPQNVLTICELEVYGELAAPAPSFSAVVKGRNIAVVQKQLCWSDALLYCRDYYWDLFSIHSTEEQRELEAVLKRASFSLTKHVWLGLRRSLMESMWFWMSGTSLNFTYWETEHSWDITSPCGSMDISNHFYWRDLPCGDHAYFICLQDIQPDVKKVEFFTTTRPQA